MMFICILLFESNRLLASKLHSSGALKQKMTEISHHFNLLPYAFHDDAVHGGTLSHSVICWML